MAGKANPCGKMREGNMVSEHTPGPWEVTGPHSREVITTNPGTYKPCMTIAKVAGYWDGEAQANAALIAAAPAMYEALSQVQAFIKTLVEADVLAYPTKLTDAVKVALAQAEGKQ